MACFTFNDENNKSEDIKLKYLIWRGQILNWSKWRYPGLTKCYLYPQGLLALQLSLPCIPLLPPKNKKRHIITKRNWTVRYYTKKKQKKLPFIWTKNWKTIQLPVASTKSRSVLTRRQGQSKRFQINTAALTLMCDDIVLPRNFKFWPHNSVFVNYLRYLISNSRPFWVFFRLESGSIKP